MAADTSKKDDVAGTTREDLAAKWMSPGRPSEIRCSSCGHRFGLWVREIDGVLWCRKCHGFSRVLLKVVDEKEARIPERSKPERSSEEMVRT